VIQVRTETELSDAINESYRYFAAFKSIHRVDDDMVIQAVERLFLHLREAAARIERLERDAAQAADPS
jgi:hypothetical protein